MSRIGKLGAFAGALALLWVAVQALDVDVRWRDGRAEALDLFGGGDKESGEQPEAFWQEGSGNEPIVPRGVPGSFADLAESTGRGVVNIRTERNVTVPQIEDLFPHFPFQIPQPSVPERRRPVPSLGTGFAISPDGYIVTNNHVIDAVEKITVVFENGDELDAKVVGRDPKTDIALLKVEPGDEVFALPLGDSDATRPGEWVVAIGNPFGLEHTVTAGIVSAKHRDIDHGAYDDYIQTDAAINPGNSGGPLLNLAGEVIGINTAINPRANTIGFAVPINMAKEILPQLRASGRVTRGWLGVVIQGVSPEIAEQLELDETQGALISKVVKDGPAADAGLEQGDVIREFDGKSIDDFDDLPRVVASTPVGKKVDVKVIRNGKHIELRPRIGELEEEASAVPASLDPRDRGSDAFGLRVQDLTDDLAEQLGLPETRGVVVSEVDPAGPAAEAGIRRGDVIIEVARREIRDAKMLEEVLEDFSGRVLMLIRRGEGQLYLTVERAG
ncbi:MAG: Do family serine endopeptidase [Myxococcota bacterium]